MDENKLFLSFLKFVNLNPQLEFKNFIDIKENQRFDFRKIFSLRINNVFVNYVILNMTHLLEQSLESLQNMKRLGATSINEILHFLFEISEKQSLKNSIDSVFDNLNDKEKIKKFYQYTMLRDFIPPSINIDDVCFDNFFSSKVKKAFRAYMKHSKLKHIFDFSFIKLKHIPGFGTRKIDEILDIVCYMNSKKNITLSDNINIMLNKKQKEILFMRYYDNNTLEEIGKRYKLTRERVRQILVKIENKIFNENNTIINNFTTDLIRIINEIKTVTKTELCVMLKKHGDVQTVMLHLNYFIHKYNYTYLKDKDLICNEKIKS